MKPVDTFIRIGRDSRMKRGRNYDGCVSEQTNKTNIKGR